MFYYSHKFILIIMLSFIVLPIAYADKRYIKCPSLDVIRLSSSKLSDVNFVNSAYIANTPPFSIKAENIKWFAVVYNLQAGSAEEAMAIAKTTMKSVSVQDNYYANNLGGILICDYDGRKVEAVNNE